MPVISKIKQTKKGRYALFCGGEFLFSIDEETYCKYAPAEGEEITDERLELLRRASDEKKALEKAWSLLSTRDHGAKELHTKLLRSFDAHTAQAAVEKLESMGYVDDAKVSRALAEELCGRKLYSVRRAMAYMREKGYDRDTSEQALAPYAESEAERIRGVIMKKYIAAPPQKIFAALMRLGFDSGDIREAMEYLEIGGQQYD